MHALIRSLCCLAVLALVSGLARAQDDANAVVAKAIKAHGGEAKLTKFKATKMKAKGTIDLMGNSVEYTMDAVSQHPDQMRNEIKIDIMGNAVTIVMVLNKKEGWRNINAAGNAQTMDLEGAELEDAKEDAYGDYLESLVPLLKDKEIKLEALGESKVEGKPAIGIKVSNKGHKDFKMFFDKESGLLVKSQRRGKDPAMNEVDVENFMSNYKEFDGVKIPLKLLVKHDGKKFLDGDISEVKLLENVDEKTFAKP